MSARPEPDQPAPDYETVGKEWFAAWMFCWGAWTGLAIGLILGPHL